MKAHQFLILLAIAMLQLLTGNAQTESTTTLPSGAAYKLSPGATEVEKLAQSGIGDDVVLSFIAQSQSSYNLSAAAITGLKDAGVSSQVLSATLNHDGALRTQQQVSYPSSPPATVTAAAPPPTANSSAATSVVVAPPPAPAPQVEVIPVTPGPDYVWTPGWWSWNDDAWIWFGGYWGYPSRPGHVWINGNFYHGRAYGSARGHWH